MMNKIKSEKRLCLICMEEHEVDTVEVMGIIMGIIVPGTWGIELLNVRKI